MWTLMFLKKIVDTAFQINWKIIPPLDMGEANSDKFTFLKYRLLTIDANKVGTPTKNVIFSFSSVFATIFSSYRGNKTNLKFAHKDVCTQPASPNP